MGVQQPSRPKPGITIAEILYGLATGATTEELLRQYPELSEADLHACFAYAATVAGGTELGTRAADREHFSRIELERVRREMIAATLSFVLGLIAPTRGTPMQGIIRISLIGSLATDKPDPKDIDLLLTVTDDMELAPLASRARKLKTTARNLQRDADIFLANPGGDYLGRTCSRRDCRPGVRLRCHALHCGARPFLHDDLQIVKLSRLVTSSPPVDLWPKVVLRKEIPNDLRQGLIEPLVKNERQRITRNERNRMA